MGRAVGGGEGVKGWCGWVWVCKEGVCGGVHSPRELRSTLSRS